MKQTIRTTILALSLGITATLSAYGASAVSYDITLSYSYINYDEPDPKERPAHPDRLPSQRIGGIVSLAEGVCINGVDTGEITLFEIYDPEGMIVASFVDEHSFVDYLFTLEGEYQLRFLTSDMAFTGWIEL